jgi:hypothetical protein
VYPTRSMTSHKHNVLEHKHIAWVIRLWSEIHSFCHIAPFCLRPVSKADAEGLGTTISPPTLCWFFLLNGFPWHIKWPMIHGTNFCQLFWQLFATFWQLFDNFWTDFWQLFENFLKTFWQLFDNFLTTFWQLFWQLYDIYFLLFDTMWHYNTFVTPQVFQFIGPSNDGQRHGRGTYLLMKWSQNFAALNSVWIPAVNPTGSFFFSSWAKAFGF